MTSAISAVEAAAYAGLSAGVTLAAVYQHVPEDTPPPVVIIGDLVATRMDVKGPDDDRDFTLSVLSITQGEERKPMLAIQAQVEAALDGLRATASGWAIQFFFSNSDGMLAENGETYVGTSHFSGLAVRT